MKLQRLFRQFPKWAIALTIFGVSTGLFVFWWVFREPENIEPDNSPPAAEVNSTDSTDKPIPSAADQAPLDLADKTLLFGDRSLYEFREGNIHLLKKDWLNSTLGNYDLPVFLEEQEVIVIGNSSGKARVLDLSGKPIGNLTLSNGETFDGYFDDDFSVAVFVKGGDLWRGQIDWPKAKIVNETQATNLGYIQGRPLKGRLLGATTSALVYRDSRLGIVGINLESGASQQLQFPTKVVSSPNGAFIVGDTPALPSQFVSFDVESFEYTTQSIPWPIQQNGLAWMSESKAALILNDQIYLYNHQDRSLKTIYNSGLPQSRITPIALPVLNQPFLVFQDPTKGIVCLNMETKELQHVNGPPANHIQMVENGGFILSSDVADSEQRGTWFGQFGKSELSRIFAQPILTKFDSNRTGRVSAFSIPGKGALYLRGFGSNYILDTNTTKLTELPQLSDGIKLIQRF